MRTAEPAPPSPAAAPPPPASALPPGAIPVPGVLAPAPPPAAAASAPLQVVEQRVVSDELKTAYDDDPDAGPQRLLEALPAEMLEGAKLPLAYTLSTSASRPGATTRVADSAPARARWYTCASFYKPISRCVGGRE
ncbi:MAG: hypothetical protein ACJ8GN_06815 [Longimicrobiaceae bacterium]